MTPVPRVQYREGQRLTASDLGAEQEYRLAAAGRHHVFPHEWGIVRGLEIVLEGRGRFVLTPGVAVDGYGREILVPERQDLGPFERSGCHAVLLYACDSPEQSPPGRACHDDPAPRTASTFHVAVTDTRVSPPSLDLDLGCPRAAGRLAGLPPWPVLVARIGRGCFPEPDTVSWPVDTTQTRYVRHRAALLRSPGGRALLRLGLTDRKDLYHFLLSTKDRALGMVRRIGIDREAVLHVWRPLVLRGPLSTAEADLGDGTALRIVAATPGAIGAVLRVEGAFDAASGLLTSSLAELGGGRSRPLPARAAPLSITGGSASKLARFGSFRTASFELLAPLLAEGKRRSSRRGEGTPHAIQRFAADLKPTGGALDLRRADEETEPEEARSACDTEGFREEAGAPLGPVLQLRPAAGIAADPLARELHAVVTSKPTDLVPRTELRISGGLADDTDASSRLAVGASATAGWMPSLRMDGRRGIEILAPIPPVGDAPPDEILVVEGTTYLPSIGKKDPLLTDLMAIAFIAGLRQAGRVHGTAPTFVLDEPSGANPTILRGSKLSYSVSFVPNVPVQRFVELIVGAAGTGDVALRTIGAADLPTFAGTTTPLKVTTPRFQHNADRVQLQLVLLVDDGGTTKVAVSSSQTLTVVDP